MKFNSQICTTREQSERLLALGLKKETADCYYYAQQRWTGNSYENTGELFLSPLWNIDDKGHFQYLNEVFGDEIGEEDTPYVLPAWSLHRLIEMMPCGFQDEHYQNFVLKINSQDVSYVYNYVDDEGYGQSDSIDVDDVYHNLYDGIIAHIKWLIKKGLFNKEYLEE